jgi:hypothetical protein
MLYLRCFPFNPLRTDGDFCHQGLMVTSVTRAGHRNCPNNLSLSKHANITIHWKALEEHFLMEHVGLLLVFRFNHFWKDAFCIFLKQPLS